MLYWLWLAEKCGPASKDFNKIIEKYDDPFDVYRLEEAEIEQFSSLSKTVRARLCQKDLDRSFEILKFCKQNRVDIISYGDIRYPESLKMIEEPPVLLYCKGHFPEFNSRLCVGVVGARSMSQYGKESAYRIAYDLAASSALTVSGMARGIDGVAACASVAAGGETVAVLGSGIDVVYPKEHKKLMDEICRHGAVITEYPPKEKPYGYNFPKRNRIISGLCQALLVVEASAASGALITAELAKGQGRQIFAVPGQISDDRAEGPNTLVKNGAFSVTCAGDLLKHYEFLYGDGFEKRRSAKKNVPVDKVLESFGLYYAISGEEHKEMKESPKKEKTVEKAIGTTESDEIKGDGSAELVASLDPVTRKIFEALPQGKAVSADAVVGDGISVSDAITALTMLELYELVSSLPGGFYIRK